MQSTSHVIFWLIPPTCPLSYNTRFVETMDLFNKIMKIAQRLSAISNSPSVAHHLTYLGPHLLIELLPEAAHAHQQMLQSQDVFRSAQLRPGNHDALGPLGYVGTLKSQQRACFSACKALGVNCRKRVYISLCLPLVFLRKASCRSKGSVLPCLRLQVLACHWCWHNITRTVLSAAFCACSASACPGTACRWPSPPCSTTRTSGWWPPAKDHKKGEDIMRQNSNCDCFRQPVL